MNDLDYAGDINPEKTWNLLKNNKDSHLIDCRTSAEWNFVGVPDLTNLGKNTHFVEWQSYPLMEKNNNFLKVESELAKSVNKGVYKKNTASRLISRLAKKIKSIN